MMANTYSCRNLTAVQDSYRIVYGSILLLATIISLFGNIVLFYIVLKLKKKIPTDILIAGIAFFDLIYIILHIISILVYFSPNCTYYLRTGTFACDFYGYLLTMISCNNVIMVVLLSLDQYLAVVHPFTYHHFVNNTSISIAFILTCIISGLHSLYPLLSQISMISIPPYYSFCHFNYRSKLPKAVGYSIFLLVMGFLVCFINIFCTISIFKTLFRIAKRRIQIQPSDVANSELNTTKANQNRILSNLLKRSRRVRRSDEFSFAKATILIFALCFSSWLAFSVRLISFDWMKAFRIMISFVAYYSS